MAIGYTALDQDDGEKHVDQTTRGKPRTWLIPWAIHGLAFVVYSALFLYMPPNIQQCVARLSNWSPGLAAVEYHEQYFQGSFVATNAYKGTPDTDLDTAWDRISTHVPAVRFDVHDFVTMGKSPTERDWHRIPDEHGGGYLGMVEVFHLLHCLNEIRKLVAPEHYPEQWTLHATPGARIHTDHCIDIIRQRLMCTGDVGPVPFYDDPRHELPMPDFSTRHQCRNFDKLLDWAYDNERAMGWDHVGDLNLTHASEA